MSVVDPHAPSGLVEIELPPVPLGIEVSVALRNLVLLLLAVLGFIWLIQALAAFMLPSGVIALAVLVYWAAWACVPWWLRGWAKAAFERDLHRALRVSPIERAVADQVCRQPGSARYAAEAALCRAFLERGGAGQTLRVGPATPATVAPFAEPFEARLLDGHDPVFVHLSAGTAAPLTAAPTRARAHVNASWRRLGPLVVAIAITLAVPAVISRIPGSGVLASPALRLGMRERAVLAVLGGGVVIGLAYYALTTLMGTQWWVVPGGLILRRTALRGPVHLRCLDRRMSVLIAVALNQRWQVAVADGATTAKRTMDTRELDILLRAWLSPIPPPARETLSDLQ